MKQRDPNNHLMIALRKSGASGKHKDKRIDSKRKSKHKAKFEKIMFDNVS